MRYLILFIFLSVIFGNTLGESKPKIRVSKDDAVIIPGPPKTLPPKIKK